VLNLMCIDESGCLCERCLGSRVTCCKPKKFNLHSEPRVLPAVLTDTMSQDQTPVQLFCINWPRNS
jgi:hypothetical protein